jgi:hypothetical protein
MRGSNELQTQLPNISDCEVLLNSGKWEPGILVGSNQKSCHVHMVELHSTIKRKWSQVRVFTNNDLDSRLIKEDN